ncbi:MAG TPA: hypothetical protein VIW29_17720 [Polyangiaceae bacterium]
MSDPAKPESAAAEPSPAAAPEDAKTEPSESAAAEVGAEAEATTSSAADEPKTSVQQSGASEDDTPLDRAGRERPRFLLAFPDHPEIARLSAAFEAGNYALVRAEAEGVAERADSEAVRDAALELRRRISPDPLSKYLLALTAALLLFLAYFAYHH